MRTPTPNGADGVPLSTWRQYKDLGRDEFQRENYSAALSAYRSALTLFPSIPDTEKQVLLSNIVACRLKIGGTAMASAAVEEAGQCIALNDRWAKGHVRLASAYIAVGGRSNDACRSLQTALNLDPGNTTARTMLMKELRRDRVARTGEDEEASGSSGGSSGGMPEPSAPPMPSQQAEDIDPSTGLPYASSPDPRHNSDTARPPPYQHQHDLDDSPSLSERCQFYLARATTWYYNLNDDTRTLIKVLSGLLVLYVAMGGRFGLDTLFGGGEENRGHYDYGNAYDRYYGRGSGGAHGGGGGTSSSYTGSGSTGGGSSSYTQGSRSTYDSYEYTARRNSSRGNSYHFPNLFDGSPLSIIVIVIFGYTCHRFGINPFHALWMLNMFTGNRGRGMHRMGGMHGLGMAGMGYGMMRNRNGGLGRRRGG